MFANPFFRTNLSISDSLKTVRKSVLIYETIILCFLMVFLHPGSTDVFHELLLIRETGKRTISKNVSQMTEDKGISPFSEILSEGCEKTGDVRHQTI